MEHGEELRSPNKHMKAASASESLSYRARLDFDRCYLGYLMAANRPHEGR